MEAVHFFEAVTNMVISRRKEGLEVSHEINLNQNITWIYF